MTAQTVAFLKGNEFTLSGAAGRITPQYEQDDIDTMELRTRSYNVRIPEYGAIGDGSSHPASTIYSLAALQAKYGTAISIQGVSITLATTMELDWLAAAYAIQQATIAGGGTVYFPPGSYVFTNASSAGDGSGTLRLPAQASGQTPMVNLVGDGGNTILNWNNDLGSGKYAIVCSANRAGFLDQSSHGVIQGINMTGPNPNGVGNKGSLSGNMTGIGSSDRRELLRVYIQNFRYGVEIQGGQQRHTEVYVQGCGYAYYFPANNDGQHGNQQFYRLVLQNNSVAAVGVGPNGIPQYCDFYGCFMAQSPWSWYKEPGGNNFLTWSCTFFDCQFEGYGVSAFGDNSSTAAPNGSNRYAQILNTRFNDSQFALQTNWIPAGFNNYGVFDVGLIQETVLDNIVLADQCVPGVYGIFVSNNFNRFNIRAGIEILAANCVTANRPMFYGFCFLSNIRVHNDWSMFWDGIVTGINGAALGTCVVITGGDSAIACAGTSADRPIGIVAYAPPGGGVSPLGIVATSGVVPSTTTGSISAAATVRVGGAGVIGTAGTNAEVGVALANQATNNWTVWLRGLS